MVVLTERMIDLIKARKCLLATTDKNGHPNIGPKSSLIILNDSTLAYGEGTGKQSLKNVQVNPRVAIAVVDFEKVTGYRFVGAAELETKGDLYEMFVKRADEVNRSRPVAAVRVRLEEIYDLSAENPGGRIA